MDSEGWLIIILISGALALVATSCSYHVKKVKDCEAKGGHYYSDRSAGVCLKPDSIIK